jgi:hypothetical protein
LQLPVSNALGDRGPDDSPPPVGLQHGAVVWSLPWPGGLALEAGRTALDYGEGRHIGRYEFHDSGHGFDGLRVRYAISSSAAAAAMPTQRDIREVGETRTLIGRAMDPGIPDVLTADLIVAKIRRNSAQPELERNLTGLYFTGRPADTLSADVYFLYISDGTEKQVVRVLTMGARVDWKPAEWLRLEGESALQVGEIHSEGRIAPHDHLATMAAALAEARGTFGVPLWLRATGAFYSGDVDPSDRITTGWRPLYPSLDRHVGLLQLFEQRNLVQSGARAGAKPHAQWQTELAAIATLARTGSPLPGFAQQVLAGEGGLVRLGTEVDAFATWQPHAVIELQALAGIFVPAQVLRNDLGAATAWQAWLQWTSRF